MPFKEHLLKKCQEHGDEWAYQVRIRAEVAVSDLHAAEARYHRIVCLDSSQTGVLFKTERTFTICKWTPKSSSVQPHFYCIERMQNKNMEYNYLVGRTI